MIKWLLHMVSRLAPKTIPSPVEYERACAAAIQAGIRWHTAEQVAEALARENADLRNLNQGLQRRYDVMIEHLANRSMHMTVPPITSGAPTRAEIRRQQSIAELESLQTARRAARGDTGSGGSIGQTFRRAIPGQFTGTEPEDL